MGPDKVKLKTKQHRFVAFAAQKAGLMLFPQENNTTCNKFIAGDEKVQTRNTVSLESDGKTVFKD